MDSVLWTLGIGLGLAAAAGLRAFAPLTLVALAVQLLSGAFPGGWTAVGVLAALAAAEIALDKPAGLERNLNRVMVPVRALSGALVVALAVDEQGTMALLRGLFGGGPDPVAAASAVGPWLLAGAAVAGTVAILKVSFRPRADAGGAGVSHATLSLFEDAVAVVGAAAGVFVPLLPALPVAFLLFFLNRVKRRRGRKYEGLRILRD